MSYKVEMLAFGDKDEIREVTLPEGEATLELIYMHGQNEVQPLYHPSVSMGDVIQFEGQKWIVAAVGFKALSDEQYTAYVATERRDRGYVYRDLLWPTPN